MKWKITYIILTVALTIAAFFVGNISALETKNYSENYINVNDIIGWEHWEDKNEAGIEIGLRDGKAYTITKVPFTLNTFVTKTE